MPPNPEEQSPREPVRLSMNLSPQAGAALRELCERRGLSMTAGVHRALALWKVVEDVQDAGGGIQVIEGDGQVRDVVFL